MIEPVPRTNPIILSEMIETAARELNASNLEAALELQKMFNLINEHSKDRIFKRSCCWVKGLNVIEQKNDNYQVSASSIALYMSDCMFKKSVACMMADGTTKDVNDEFIAFDPPELMEQLNGIGYSWVPRKGVYSHADIPKIVAFDALTNSLPMPYETSELVAMQAAAQKYWIDFDRNRPPLQKTVSSFIAERLGLATANRKTDALAGAIRPANAPNER